MNKRLSIAAKSVLGVGLISLFLTPFSAAREEMATTNAVLDLPFYDAPFNSRDGYTLPSMRQSLMLSKDYYEAGHLAIAGACNGPIQTTFALMGFDLLSVWLPGGASWTHEEWHRAVLSRNGIDSYDDVYNMVLFADSIAVSHVRDDDLISLKREHPAEFVRLAEAGLEAEYELNFAIEKDCFFDGVPLHSTAVLWLNTANSIYYVYICGTKEADDITEEANAKDGVDVDKRDFIGLDFTAWVYDLFRPDEPYENRGTHPSGTGIDRYRGLPDLTSEEREYLRLQGRLQFINLLDPFLLGFTEFPGHYPLSGESMAWNVNARHYLTSFGYVIDANILLRQGDHKWAVIFHNYANHESFFPGLDVQMLRCPFHWAGRTLRWSPRVALWAQPEDQEFRTTHASLGGMAALRVEIEAIRNLEPYVELSAKTDGWLAGDANLDSSYRGIVGMRVDL